MLAIWVCLFTLLAVPAAVPDDRVLSAYSAGLSEITSNSAPTPVGGYVDKFMECLGMLIFSGEDRVKAVVFAEYPQVSTAQPCLEYGSAAQSNRLEELLVATTSYSRYWHGYAVITRPAMAFAGVDALRIGTAIAGLLAVFLLVWQGTKTLGLIPTVALVAAPLIFTDAFWLPNSLLAAWHYVPVIFGFSLVLVTSRNCRDTTFPLLAAICATGAMAAFFDALVSAPVSWSVSIFLATATLSLWTPLEARGLRKLTRQTLLMCALWLGAFCSTWGLRWAATIPFSDWRTVFNDVFGSATQWSNTFPPSTPFGVQRWAGLVATLEEWSNQTIAPEWLPFTIPILLITSLAFAGSRGWGRVGLFWIRAIPILLVPLWLVALPNHTVTHDWFMYRGWAYVLGMAACSWVLLALPLNHSRGSNHRQEAVLSGLT